jgi:methylmalonyl-CoA mutase cobalamin-binding domain/chain
MEERLKPIAQAMADLDEEAALAFTRGVLADGISGLDIVAACEEGMREVGQRYEQKEIFLTGLVMAAEIFREIFAIVSPELERHQAPTSSHRVLLGTVEGDIHDIGKNTFRTLLRAYGFTVIDLGVDVPPSRFLQVALEERPDIIGLSGLVTASTFSMKYTIDQLHQAGDELKETPVIIGGGTIDDEVARVTGADYWTTEAMQGIRVCQRLAAAMGCEGA